MSKMLNIKPLGFPWQTQDPFLFCAYHRDLYPQGDGTMRVSAAQLQGRNVGQDFNIKDGWRMYHGSRVPGFPYHPHRGFETITINKEGVVDHTDSLGAAGRFMAGDVQWMTAGRGVQHSEMFPMLHADKPNTLEIFQIWLNLPARSKMVDPHFKMLWREDIPIVKHKDSQGNSTVIDIIAGKINDVNALAPTPDSWAAEEAHAVGVFTVKMEPNANWILPATHSNANRSIFYYQGKSMALAGTQVESGVAIEAMAGENIEFQNGDTESWLLILEGTPINEPVVQHGPFVMNTTEEIREAMREYGRTEFGGWPWPEREMVHPADKGRFALYADGKEEVR